MRRPNKLTMRGAGPHLSLLMERLERPLAGGWRRYAEAESRLTGLGLSGGRSRCFACSAEGRRPVAALWLETRGADLLSVDNIIPLDKRELSDDESDVILADFESEVLQQACDGLDVQIEVSPNRVGPEVYLSPEACRRLEAFSASANKNPTHREDCPRWREFIIQAHIEGADFDPSLLDQWLAEEGWPADQRQHLVREYETTRSILAAYDEERLVKCLS